MNATFRKEFSRECSVHNWGGLKNKAERFEGSVKESGYYSNTMNHGNILSKKLIRLDSCFK